MSDSKEDRIAKLAEQIGKLQPSAQATQRAMDRVRNQLLAGRAPSAHRRRNIMMKIGIPSVATAAAIVIAATLWLTPRPGSPGSAYAELLQAVENTRKAEWTHFFENDGREIWLSFKPFRSFEKGPGGRAAAIDTSKNLEQRYDPETNTVTLRIPDVPDGFADSDNLLDSMLRKVKSEHLVVNKSTEQINGRETLVYTFTAEPGHGLDNADRRLRFFVDPATRRLIGADDSKWGKLEIDFLEKGPADIYALGVPKDAKVVDKRAEAASRKNTKTDFAAVVAGLIADTADLAEVKKLLGEPRMYYDETTRKMYSGRDTSADDLAHDFSALYPDDVAVRLTPGGEKVTGVFRNKSRYSYFVGATLGDILQAVGQPSATVEGEKIAFKDGVLYKHAELNGAKDVSYYGRSDKGVRFWFKNDRLFAYETAERPEAEPVAGQSATASTASSKNIKANFAAMLAELDIATADLERVKKIFGEPAVYYGRGGEFPPGTPVKDLPSEFSAVYPDNLQIYMIKGGRKVVELRCTQPGYFFDGKIQVGSPLADVLETVGQPRETVEGGKIEFKDGVLYKNLELPSESPAMSSRKGVSYYGRQDKGVRFWFANDKVMEIDIGAGATDTSATASSKNIKANFAAMLAELDIATANLERVKKVFGEPLEYYGDHKQLPGDTPAKDLPNWFRAVYPDNLQISMTEHGQKVVEVTCTQPGYFFEGKIQVGSSLADVLAAIGEPRETVEGGKIEFKDGVLYKNAELDYKNPAIPNKEGISYYARSDKGVRFWIKNDKVTEIGISGIRKQPASATASAPGR